MKRRTIIVLALALGLPAIFPVGPRAQDAATITSNAPLRERTTAIVRTDEQLGVGTGLAAFSPVRR